MDTSLVIVGAGPVGLCLAHQLGRRGIPTLVVEAEPTLSDEPRAVGLDPESLRMLQALDLVDALSSDILFGVTGDYINGAGEMLFALEDDRPGPFGYPSLNGFSQPGLVRVLAQELARYDCVELRFDTSLTGFSQTETAVQVQIESADGSLQLIEADFLVGCDGGRSTVRSLLGIKMQGESNPLPWLVIDTREQEDDGKSRFRFFCDPARPGMFIQTPHANRRWEWMVLPGEDRESFLRDDVIESLIAPYVDTTKVDIYRRRVYDFHSIIAEKFQQGRVFLAGDSAHMTPPFAGQGLNSGLRDVANLGWKMAAVINQGAPLSLLESYELERWQHAREVIDVAVNLGNQIQPTDPELAASRDQMFAELNAGPAAEVEEFIGGIFKSIFERYFSQGAAVDIEADFPSGRLIPQPMIRRDGGSEVQLDKLLGEGFSILSLDGEPEQLLEEAVLAPWLKIGTRPVHIGRKTGKLQEAGSSLHDFFAGSSASMFLVRPDRFCMAAFDQQSAGRKLSAAARMLGLAEET